MFKVDSRNTRKRCEIFWKLTKRAERRHWLGSDVFIANFEHISHLFLVFYIVYFEQVNVSWKVIVFCKKGNLSNGTHSKMIHRENNSLQPISKSLQIRLPWVSFIYRALIITIKIFLFKSKQKASTLSKGQILSLSRSNRFY